jgi:hypothetical protein
MFEKLLNLITGKQKYGAYSSVTDLTNQERRKLAEFCREYCMEVIGVPRKKGIPSFSIVKTNKEYYGEYCSERERIFVFYNNCGTIQKFVETFIHEYVHHTQNLTKYDKWLSKYGYDDHPLEVEAREVAKKYRGHCLESYRKRI